MENINNIDYEKNLRKIRNHNYYLKRKSKNDEYLENKTNSLENTDIIIPDSKETKNLENDLKFEKTTNNKNSTDLNDIILPKQFNDKTDNKKIEKTDLKDIDLPNSKNNEINKKRQKQILYFSVFIILMAGAIYMLTSNNFELKVKSLINKN